MNHGFTKTTHLLCWVSSEVCLLSIHVNLLQEPFDIFFILVLFLEFVEVVFDLENFHGLKHGDCVLDRILITAFKEIDCPVFKELLSHPLDFLENFHFIQLGFFLDRYQK